MDRFLLVFGVCVIALSSARGQEAARVQSGLRATQEVTLDMDGDGKPDLAVLTFNAENGADLAIYLGHGDGPLDLSRKPTLRKNNIAGNIAVTLESKGGKSLKLSSSCGGCSNSYETILTIAYRGGAFIVAGYTLSWDTRTAAGECDINFLAGMGTVSKGIDGRARPLKGSFAPTKLADWSEKHEPRVCSALAK
jgi:hypothetical protein